MEEPPAEEKRFDAFVSYSHFNRDFIVQLQSELRRFGKSIWVDESDIPSGSRWEEVLKVAIENADSFIFAISPQAAASEQCNRELSYAVELHKRIIPLNLQ